MTIAILKNDGFCQTFIEHQENFYPDLNIKFFSFDKKIESKSLKVEIVSVKSLSLFVNENDIERIIIPILRVVDYKFIRSIKKTIPIVWIFYGTEVFNRPKYKKRFLTEQTRKLLGKRIYFSKAEMKSNLFAIKYKFYQSKYSSKISSIGICNPIDFEMIQQLKEFSHLKSIPFCFGTKLSPNVDARKEKKILVGISGYYFNNHIDGFNYIKEHDLNDYKVYVILSYPKENSYMKKIEKIGQKMFGDRFVVIKNYMDYKSYISFLAKFDIAIIPSIRTLGGSNLRNLINSKTKLVLHPQGFSLKHFRNIELEVATLDDDVSLFYNDQKLYNNAKIVREYSTQDHYKQFYKNLFFD